MTTTTAVQKKKEENQFAPLAPPVAKQPKQATTIGPQQAPKGPQQATKSPQQGPQPAATAKPDFGPQLPDNRILAHGFLCRMPNRPVRRDEVCWHCGAHGHYAATCRKQSKEWAIPPSMRHSEAKTHAPGGSASAGGTTTNRSYASVAGSGSRPAKATVSVLY